MSGSRRLVTSCSKQAFPHRCGRRATGCDLDHTIPWARVGHTRYDNLAHLCRKHHRLEHHTRWRMSQTPSGDIRWTSPAGHEYLTSPDQPFRAMRSSAESATEAQAEAGDVAPNADHVSEARPPWAAEDSAA